MSEPERYLLKDDGLVPNNERLPLLVYRAAIALDRAGRPERVVQRQFEANCWSGSWVDGIYPFHHYHARSHEVLAVVAGRARVQFGGRDGPEMEIAAGDAVVLPAGTGHCRKDNAPGLVVVGAYPRGQEDWDLKRDNETDHAQALREIPHVALPSCDPVLGKDGPLVRIWR